MTVGRQQLVGQIRQEGYLVYAFVIPNLFGATGEPADWGQARTSPFGPPGRDRR